MQDLQSFLTEQFRVAIVKAFGEAHATVDPLVRPAGNPKFGDYQANLAMSLAKVLGAKPRDIASKIVDALDKGTWAESGRIPVYGQPVFVVARPDNRQVWVNFAPPHNDTVQVIDVPSGRIVHTLKPGKAVLHMEFTPRGEQLWLSVRDDDRVDVYDTENFARIGSLPVDKPSGIFFTARAHRIGL